MPIINVTNPGLINVADEAYPPPPPDFQAIPLPELVTVADQGYTPANPSSGAGVETGPSVNIEGQLDTIQLVEQEEVIVTEAGNFKTNPVPSNFQTFVVTAVADAETGGALSADTKTMKITLAQSLVPFGVDFAGREAEAVVAATASAVGQTRVINFMDVNIIYCPYREGGTLSGPTFDLQANDVLKMEVGRIGFEVVTQQTGIPTNRDVQTSTGPIEQLEPNVFEGAFAGNFFPESVPTFIGGGLPAPPFLGTFEVEDQPVLGLGLPVNVFQ